MPRLFAVSQENPDPTGAQMKSLLEYLARRHLIRWVWFDFSCTYQGKRTMAQQRDFDGMLPHINLLYLGASVLILFDLRYMNRFWTQLEAVRMLERKILEPPSASGIQMLLRGHWNISSVLPQSPRSGSPSKSVRRTE